MAGLDFTYYSDYIYYMTGEPINTINHPGFHNLTSLGREI